MHKRIEDFTARELVQRKYAQELLHIVLTALKQALDERRYNDAVFLNIQGTRALNIMVQGELALADEVEMLDTLRENAVGILRLQHRLQ
jgi:hypothetical protein